MCEYLRRGRVVATRRVVEVGRVERQNVSGMELEGDKKLSAPT
jgi:hypothetical protein